MTSSFCREADKNCAFLGYLLRSSAEECTSRPEHLQRHEKEIQVA